MTRRTAAFALLSSLVLGAGACKSNLFEPAGPGILGQSGADDPAEDDRGITITATDTTGVDDHGGNRDNGGRGRGGADDPVNHH